MLGQVMLKRAFARKGFTLIELMIGLAVIAIILVLAIPSFHSFILLQRLKSINSQVVTDIQWARSEAISRGQPVRIRFQGTAEGSRHDLACYIIYIDTVLNESQSVQFSTPPCDCKAAETAPTAASARCTSATTQELRTVQLEAGRSVMLDAAPYNYGSAAAPNLQDHQGFDPRTGGVSLWATDVGIADRPDFTVFVYLNDSLKFGNQIGRTGRVRTCIPAGSTLPGDACS